MKLEVIEHLRYVFEIPPNEEAAVRKDADAWFANLKKPWAEAETFAVTDRDCNISDDHMECANCDWRGREEDLKNPFPNIPKLTERVAPGEEMPAGECPKCGALCHPISKT